jgi:hypothetical protein
VIALLHVNPAAHKALVRARKALVLSWPILKRLYRVGFWVTIWAIAGLMVWCASVDDAFGPAVENYFYDIQTLSVLLGEYLVGACGMITVAAAYVSPVLGVLALALLISFAFYGSVKLLRTIGRGDA